MQGGIYSLCVLLLLFSASLLVSSQNTGRFIVLSDLHYAPERDSNPPAPTDITYNEDSPVWLINSAIETIADTKTVPTPIDFILVTGDLVSHNLSSKIGSESLTYLKLILTTLSGSFANTLKDSNNKFVTSPLICLGNNDLFPKYAAPGTTEWFKTFAASWPSLNYTSDSYDTFLKTGSYALDVPTGGASKFVRVISLHTNYWSISNKNTANDTDPAGIFAWLQAQLQKAKADGVKVYIMGHVPPGLDHYAHSPQWQERFVPVYLDTVTPYLGNTIIAQFFGHEHVALFRMLPPQVQRSSMFSRVLSGGSKGLDAALTDAGPIRLHTSISPVYDNNPTFREYTYDKDTLQLLDFAEWYLNFTANPTNPTWKQRFASAVSPNILPNLQSAGYCDLINNLYQNDTLFSAYYYGASGYSPELGPCDADCKQDYLCNAQFLLSADYQNCVVNKTRLACQPTPPVTTTGPTTGGSATTRSATTHGNTTTSTTSGGSHSGKITVLMMVLMLSSLLLSCM